MNRRHSVTFTTQEIVLALIDKFGDEFSQSEIQGEPRIYQLGDGTWEVRYESAVLG